MPGRTDDIEYLSSLVSEQKRKVIANVLQYRTRFVTTVLENITQPHNANAVIRSCDIFGVQDMHVIESDQQFQIHNTISKGAARWVDIYRYESTKECLTHLKKQGYRIVATTPHERGKTLSDLAINQKTALLFGTEIKGISDEAIALADEFVTIPMFGFTKSFNISVSAGICLHHIIMKLHLSTLHWQLSAKENEELQRVWLQKVLHIKS